MAVKPHFLIVTPSYNQGQFIKQTIDSVLNQQGDFEVSYVVMDGGSSDDTVALLKSYGKKLTWFSEKDKGQTNAINKGIEFFKKIEQQGDAVYFAYINSDDYYLPHTFQTAAKAFAEHKEKQWVSGDCLIVNQDGLKIQSWIKWYKILLRNLLEVWPSLLCVLNPITQPATFIRWSAVKKVGEFDETLRYVMDYDYWLRLKRDSGLPLFLSENLASFRIHQTSKGGSQFIKQFEEQYLIAKRYTTNGMILFLHRVHNWITTVLYRLIK